jgi:dsRNA-specific ribonuclease
MNAYETSINLGLTGTDAEQVATLKATGVTARPISLAELLFLLNFRGMLTKLVNNNSDEKWSGTVLAMKAAIAADAVATAHVDRWLSHITNPRNTHWDTTDANYAAPFWALSQAVAGGPGMPSVEDFAAVAALGGGWLFADLTAEQFAEQRQSAINAQAAAELAAEWSTLLNELIHPAASNRASLIAALRSAADTLEAN